MQSTSFSPNKPLCINILILFCRNIMNKKSVKNGITDNGHKGTCMPFCQFELSYENLSLEVNLAVQFLLIE